MSECNYDEVTHSIYPPENLDPMYHWDAHFPERLSRLHLSLEFSGAVFRRTRRAKERCTGRYKTQPITFDEITEVDEESTNLNSASGAGPEMENSRDAKTTLFRSQTPGFFSRSVDGLVASRYIQAKSGTSTGSDKENTPCEPDRKLGSVFAENRTQSSEERCSALEGAVPLELSRHRRKRSGRKLRNRNAVPEEVLPEVDKTDDKNAVVG